jgi:hypothetical protein
MIKKEQIIHYAHRYCREANCPIEEGRDPES